MEENDSDGEISLIFNKYFSSTSQVSSLSILRYEDPLVHFESIEDPFDLLQEKYKNHPCILAVLGKWFENILSFRSISEVRIENKILWINDQKTSQQFRQR